MYHWKLGRFLLIIAICSVLALIGQRAKAAPTATTQLPVGKTAYKIKVDTTGIHAITFEMLETAGMNVATVNPTNLKLLHKGETVAYEWDGNSNNVFEAGERMLFYGWAFDGSRHDELFVDENYFWVWEDDSAGARITQQPAVTGATTPISHTRHEVVHEGDAYFTLTYTPKWDTFENEATPYYLDRFYITNLPNSPQTKSYEVALPNPVDDGSQASYAVEMFTERRELGHLIETQINSQPSVSETWNFVYSGNVEQTVPMSAIADGANQFQVTFDNIAETAPSSGYDLAYLRGITVNYARALVATNDTLGFEKTSAGDYLFTLSGFSEANAANLRVWDITNRLVPTQLPITAVVPNGGSNQIQVGVNQTAAQAAYFATSTTDVIEPTVEAYFVQDLEPATNSAEWLAITHPLFRTETERLAAHRQSFSGLTTHVVNSDDVINQYGYGYPLPEGIQSYIRHGYADWTGQQLQYVTLMGIGSINARDFRCATCSTNWLKATHLLPTDLIFEDRRMGIVASDHLFSMMDDTDLNPDVAVGRFAVATVAEMKAMVDKVLLYEANLVNQTPESFEVLFASDNRDGAGDFCLSNDAVIADEVPNSVPVEHYCLDDYPNTDQAAFHDDIVEKINNGLGILNYRGHGSVHGWGSGDGIMSVNDQAAWQNSGNPIVIISADCLDGHFAWLTDGAFSNTFLRLAERRGTAAHWSSTGLGYGFEHDRLLRHFYSGMFDEGIGRIGDLTNHSKTLYNNEGYNAAEMYSFVLQGDPAMLLYPTVTPQTGDITSALGLPTSENVQGNPGSTVEQSINIINPGTVSDSYRVTVTIDGTPTVLTTDTLPPRGSTTLTFDVPIPPSAEEDEIILADIVIMSLSDGSTTHELQLPTTVVLGSPTAVGLSAQSANSTLAGLQWIVLITALITTLLFWQRRNAL